MSNKTIDKLAEKIKLDENISSMQSLTEQNIINIKKQTEKIINTGEKEKEEEKISEALVTDKEGELELEEKDKYSEEKDVNENSYEIDTKNKILINKFIKIYLKKILRKSKIFGGPCFILDINMWSLGKKLGLSKFESYLLKTEIRENISLPNGKFIIYNIEAQINNINEDIYEFYREIKRKQVN